MQNQTVTAMVDIGAVPSAISPNLTHKLGLKIQNTEWTAVGVGNTHPGTRGIVKLPVKFVNQNDYDIIGNDPKSRRYVKRSTSKEEQNRLTIVLLKTL